LGKVKDIGKMEELLSHALKESGAVSTQTQARTLAKSLVQSHPSYLPVVRTANSIYHAMTDEESGLNQALNSALKEQKKWEKRDCKEFLKSLGKK